ncbi:unnamed protein product [Adineta steineri]|uniref:Uncharacterized protein n=1 Tax=Adineta steineri TaxID=433720 RepID=A0A813MIP1_9BILA|nr:unnamed protein product [Adineta steineri]
MKECYKQDKYDIHSFLLSDTNSNKCNNTHRQLNHQLVIIKNLERSLKHNETSVDNEFIPDYYQWSLCNINDAYDNLFNEMSSQRSQSFITSKNSQKLEQLSYFNYKKMHEFSLIYDRIIHGDYIYLQQHFGTSQMVKPHPMRHSIPYEESVRWMPVRSSSMIGRRAHLPLDTFCKTSKIN